MNYYNEYDPGCAAWLRRLIAADLIPYGDVDMRSICNVHPHELDGYQQCHFFAGVGGWSRALRLAGVPDDFPLWTGSCPCQPFSDAGKGEAQADPRHLWPYFFRLIRQQRPAIVFGEQVAGAIKHGWLDGVCDDMEAEKYAVGAHVLPACSVGAPHIRARLWWVAQSGSTERGGRSESAGEHGGALHLANGSGLVRLADAEPLRTGDGSQGSQGSQGGGGHRPAIGGDLGGLGDPASGGLGIDGGPSGSGGHDEQPSTADGLSHAQRPPGSPQHEHDTGEGPAVATADGTGVVGDCPSDGGVGHTDSSGCGELRRPVAMAQKLGGIECPSGYGWDNFRIAPCRDGKSRRIEPDSSPLAHGIPSNTRSLRARLCELGISAKVARRIIADAKANRVIRLKGYGNAIVPQLAAEFIRAFFDLSRTNGVTSCTH